MGGWVAVSIFIYWKLPLSGARRKFENYVQKNSCGLTVLTAINSEYGNESGLYMSLRSHIHTDSQNGKPVESLSC